MVSNQPIGIFDSGIGGLTVARAVKDILPKESILYFGDSAHLPYGDKSPATIQAYSVKICDVLLKYGCKVILMACNSASSAAYELIKAYAGSKALVFNVIDPVVAYVAARYPHKHVGMIGTKQTVNSGVYEEKLKAIKKHLRVSSVAAPLLVPMIEEGFHKDEISEQVIARYLSDEALREIDALILGCTHYPLIKAQISGYYRDGIEIIDSSVIVAKALGKQLAEDQLLSGRQGLPDRFLVSDFTPSFQAAAQRFFQQNISLEKHTLWE